MKLNYGYLGHIENLRGIAAMFVVLFHFISNFNGERFIVENEKLRKLSEFGAQGVEMFYIISGFVIAYSLSRHHYEIKHYPKYVLKRILRIVPNYWATILAIALISWFLNSVFWGGEYNWPWLQMLASALYASDLFPQYEWFNVIFVTLKVEIQFYFFVGLIFPLLQKNYFIRFALFAIWLFVGQCTNGHQTLFVNGPYFILGLTLYELYRRKEMKYNAVLVLVILAFLFQFYSIEDFIIAIISGVYIMWVHWENKVLSFVGKISYSLYLVHGLSGGWMLFFLSRGACQNMSPFLMIVLAILFSIGVSYLFYRFVEKPSMKWSKSIRYKK